jgi:hypothetical protein
MPICLPCCVEHHPCHGQCQLEAVLSIYSCSLLAAATQLDNAPAGCSPLASVHGAPQQVIKRDCLVDGLRHVDSGTKGLPTSADTKLFNACSLQV